MATFGSVSSKALATAAKALARADDILSNVTRDKIAPTAALSSSLRFGIPSVHSTSDELFESLPTVVIYIAATYQDRNDEPSTPLCGPACDLKLLLDRTKARTTRPRILLILADFEYVDLTGRLVIPNEDNRPTVKNMARLLRAVNLQLRSTDKVLFHYGGHGLREPALSSITFLRLPKDQQIFAYHIRQWLIDGASDGVVFLFFFDACHIGNFFELGFVCEDGKTVTGPKAQPLGHQIFTFTGASSEEESASVGWAEDPKMTHGAFTWYLLENLPPVGSLPVKTSDLVWNVYDKCAVLTKSHKPVHPVASASYPFPDRLIIL